MAVNGVHVVQGECDTLVALLQKARRHRHALQGPSALEDPDLRNLADLNDVLNEVADIADMNPSTFLSPFLEIIKSKDTNGPVTEAALDSVARFLNYGLIDSSSIKASYAVESISQAVTHTKFVGGASAGSDECVLFKILQVLRSLLLSPPGRLLSNESVCDMMQSCFRICFEQHLSELLRKSAQSTLSDMTQLIFTRLPTFEEDIRHPYIRKLVMNAKGAKGEKRRRRRKRQSVKQDDGSVDGEEADVEVIDAKDTDALLVETTNKQEESVESSEVPKTEATTVADPNSPETQHMVDMNATGMGYDVVLTTGEQVDCVTKKDPTPEPIDLSSSVVTKEEPETESDDGNIPVVLRRDRRSSTPEEQSATSISTALQMPYGLPCARELLRFLIGLTNPVDRQNTESMIVLGLNLLIVALEAAADHLASYPFLLPLIKDDLCRSLLQLLDTEKLPILASTARACFLLFESMRLQLKFQLEAYFHKLRSIVVSEQIRYDSPVVLETLKSSVSYEKKEMALKSIVRFWRIPGLVTELYLNYDCDLYCSNIFEDLTKLLVENAFPVQGLMSTSLLSLDALLVVIDTIEQNCVYRNAGAMPPCGADVKSSTSLALPLLSGFVSGKEQNEKKDDLNSAESQSAISAMGMLPRSNRHATNVQELSMSKVIEQKKRKRIFAEGTELFNQSPKKGIEYLRGKGLLGSDPQSLVQWLRENPRLDKKRIAEYICSRKHADVLETFVKSFAFANTRLDDALRMFLETFRLPGEAAEISMVMQHFSEHWYAVNNEPFNHVDAAFTLSYAVIMLNMDQHNPQVRRQQPPMTVDCFKRNLSGTNGNGNFDPHMLEDIYKAIKSDEIVMPAEQVGTVKDNYLWKVLLRRGETDEGRFIHAPTGWNDHDLFAITWGPAIAALSYVLDKSEHEVILQKALNGYRKCASIAAHYGMSDVFDNLIIHLCKFSTLMTSTEGSADENLEMQRQRSLNENLPQSSPEAIAIAFGENAKAHMATRAVFELVHNNGDILREGWKNMLDCLLQLFRARLLPGELTEVEDFSDPKGWVSIARKPKKSMPSTRSDTGLLSWFGLGGTTSDAHANKKPTEEQEKCIKAAQTLIAECQPQQIIHDSKYLTSSALSELLNAISQASQTITNNVELGEKTEKARALNQVDEDSLIFYLELIISISLENKDRISMVWPVVKRHVEWLVSRRFGKNPLLVERAVVGLLRVVNRNLFRDSEETAHEMLKSLAIVLTLPPQAMFILSRQIAFGLHELIRNNAANVHKKEDWAILFSLLEVAGAAVYPDDIGTEALPLLTGERNAHSDGEQITSGRYTTDDRGYTSEDVDRRNRYASNETLVSDAGTDSAVESVNRNKDLGRSQEWIHLDHKDAAKATEDALRSVLGNSATTYNRGSLMLRPNLGRHEPAAFLKVCETLSFLLRDAAHVTPENFESSVQCLRTFVEASLDGGKYAAGPLSGEAQNKLHADLHEERQMRKSHKGQHHKGKELSTEVEGEGEDAQAEEKQLSANYLQMSLQLLDLCHTLHIKAPGIYASWAGEGVVDATAHSVWNVVWRPLLQAMARLCCDCRRQLRAQALNYLVRAFLITDLQSLGAADWDSCFGEVLFPLLGKLLERFSPMDPLGMEETRVRAIQLVAKTLLNHLSSLASLQSFPSLWLRLLDYMEKYLRVERSESLSEAVPESLKNMLLVLDSTGMFTAIPGLYQITVDRMSNVLPTLIKEVLPNPPPQQAQQESSELPAASLLGQPTSPAARKVILAPVPVTSGAGVQQHSSASTSVEHQQQKDVLDGGQSTVDSLEGSQKPGHPEPTAPVQVPEVPLTEVIVHSGPTSPMLPSSPAETTMHHFDAPTVAEAVQQVQQQLDADAAANSGSTTAVTSASVSSIGEQQLPAQQQQQPAYYQQSQQFEHPQQYQSQGFAAAHAAQEAQAYDVSRMTAEQQQQYYYYQQYYQQQYAQHAATSQAQQQQHIVPQTYSAYDQQQQHNYPYQEQYQQAYPAPQQQQHQGYPVTSSAPYSSPQHAANPYPPMVDPDAAMATNPLAGIMQQLPPTVSSYSVANPLPIPGVIQHPVPHQPYVQPGTAHSVSYTPSQPKQLATSPTSAFTQLHDPSRHPHVPPSVHQSFFQPIDPPTSQPPPPNSQ